MLGQEAMRQARADQSSVQKIQYAKSKSDTISKLAGTFRLPTAQVAVTELQQSIFNAPPSSSMASTLKPPDPAASKQGVEEGGRSPQGVKRRREDEASEAEHAPMDEDDDGDAPMEDSSEEE